VASTHVLVEREARRRKKFYDRLSRLLDRKLPQLLKRADFVSKLGLRVRVSTSLRPRYANLSPVPIHAVDYDTFTRLHDEAVNWVIDEANRRLAALGSPLRASILESGVAGFIMWPNALVLELPEPVE
jgi:hypothetical protein